MPVRLGALSHSEEEPDAFVGQGQRHPHLNQFQSPDKFIRGLRGTVSLPLFCLVPDSS
jgi:hypothetical protein